MTYPSPLRYPGGKKKLIGFVKDVIECNDLLGGTYIEPFAGGASVALSLLFTEYINNIVINDIDRSIYAFWYSVINNTEDLCRLIRDRDSDRRLLTLSYTAAQKIRGSEMIAFSDNFVVPTGTYSSVTIE